MIDVIVLDIDGGTMLEECVASIRAQSVSSRIIVFDNGSKTATRNAAARSETNLGFAGGANAALRLSSAPYVALVNNDVVLEPDWLEQVRDALDRDEQLAAVQTIIARPDGRIDGAGIDISDGTFRQIAHGSSVGAPLRWPGVSPPRPRSTAAPRSGRRFFEERFFAYYEDVELSARLRAPGWRIAVLPVVAGRPSGSQTAPLLRPSRRSPAHAQTAIWSHACIMVWAASGAAWEDARFWCGDGLRSVGSCEAVRNDER